MYYIQIAMAYIECTGIQSFGFTRSQELPIQQKMKAIMITIEHVIKQLTRHT